MFAPKHAHTIHQNQKRSVTVSGKYLMNPSHRGKIIKIEALVPYGSRVSLGEDDLYSSAFGTIPEWKMLNFSPAPPRLWLTA